MPCGWEGNRRSDVTLAMRHRLQLFIHLRAHGLRKGDEHPAYNRHGVWHSFFTRGIKQMCVQTVKLLTVCYTRQLPDYVKDMTMLQ